MKKGYIFVSLFIALFGFGVLTTPMVSEASWNLSIGFGFGGGYGGGFYDGYGYMDPYYGYGGYDMYSPYGGYGGNNYFGSNVYNNYYGGYPAYGYNDVIYPTYGYYDIYANNPYNYGGGYGNYNYGGWYGPGFVNCLTYSC